VKSHPGAWAKFQSFADLLAICLIFLGINLIQNSRSQNANRIEDESCLTDDEGMLIDNEIIPNNNTKFGTNGLVALFTFWFSLYWLVFSLLCDFNNFVVWVVVVFSFVYVFTILFIFTACFSSELKNEDCSVGFTSMNMIFLPAVGYFFSMIGCLNLNDFTKSGNLGILATMEWLLFHFKVSVLLMIYGWICFALFQRCNYRKPN